MAGSEFLTNHANVLLCIAREPDARLRDIAASTGLTERAAFGLVSDLVEEGYVTRKRRGRRNSLQGEAEPSPARPAGQRAPGR
jgi:DNA-binding IclR family transcriptional regulator